MAARWDAVAAGAFVERCAAIVRRHSDEPRLMTSMGTVRGKLVQQATVLYLPEGWIVNGWRKKAKRST